MEPILPPVPATEPTLPPLPSSGAAIPPPIAGLAPPQFGVPPTGADRTLAVLCHVSLMLGVGFVLPLIVFVIKNHESPWVGAHAREVLNFHLTLILYGVIGFVLVFLLIGIPLLILLAAFAFVCAIIGAIRATEGELYHYPLTIRLF